MSQEPFSDNERTEPETEQRTAEQAEPEPERSPTAKANAKANADPPPGDAGEDDAYREASEWGLDDLKASDDPVERYITVRGEERRLLVLEASDADAPTLERESSPEVYRALAQFYRDHILEPSAFADVTADDVREMRMGIAEKLLNAIVPDSSGNRL